MFYMGEALYNAIGNPKENETFPTSRILEKLKTS